MTPNPFILSDDETSLTMVDVSPLNEYTAEYLKSIGIVSHYVRHPYYSLERAERHANARMAMALIYSQGAAIINHGLANERFTLTPVEFAAETAESALIEMTPQQSRVAKQYQIALSKVPETRQVMSGDGHYEQNLLQAALIAKIALAHMEPALISTLFEKIYANHQMMTVGPKQNFILPNGSYVNESLAQAFLSLHIVANGQNFTSNQVSRADTWLKTYPPTTLFAEVLISLGHVLKRVSSASGPHSWYILTHDLISTARDFLVGFYNRERSAFAHVEEVTVGTMSTTREVALEDEPPISTVITTDNTAIAPQESDGNGPSSVVVLSEPTIQQALITSSDRGMTGSHGDGGLSVMSVDGVPGSASSTEANEAPLKEVKDGLQAYITKIETVYQNNFRHGFWFFKDSQAENRQANYLLAQNLLERLNESESVETVFPSKKALKELRCLLISGNKFRDHGIHSNDLNKVLNAGIELAKQVKRKKVVESHEDSPPIPTR
jgi:hypothetical protein